MWEIYSIGDSAYLAAILNAVAMITGTGLGLCFQPVGVRVALHRLPRGGAK